MTLCLILMRHAKSDWDHPGRADFDRGLNQRGSRDARAIGHWLKVGGHVPDQAICSAARRTRDTAQLLDLDIAVEPQESLYGAGLPALWAAVHAARGTRLLLVAHNPGIAHFAHDLVSQPVERDAFNRYPTCATLIAEFDAPDWHHVSPRSGRAVDFVVPKDLHLHETRG